MFDTAVPSIVNVEDATPSGSAAFQLMRRRVCDTATWPTIGPLLAAATIVKAPVAVEEWPALSVAVITY